MDALPYYLVVALVAFALGLHVGIKVGIKYTAQRVLQELNAGLGEIKDRMEQRAKP